MKLLYAGKTNKNRLFLTKNIQNDEIIGKKGQIWVSRRNIKSGPVDIDI